MKRAVFFEAHLTIYPLDSAHCEPREVSYRLRWTLTAALNHLNLDLRPNPHVETESQHIYTYQFSGRVQRLLNLYCLIGIAY